MISGLRQLFSGFPSKGGGGGGGGGGWSSKGVPVSRGIG